MAYCGPRGIAHSVFLGSASGWTQQDRDKALAWQELQRQTCNGCGTRTEEWDPSQGGDLRAYSTEIRVCLGCEVLERGRTELEDPDSRGQRGRQIVMRRASPSPAGALTAPSGPPTR